MSKGLEALERGILEFEKDLEDDCNNEWLKRVVAGMKKCYHCDCKYEFERQDTITMDKSPDGIIQMRCPYCKRIVTFSRRSVSTREEKIYK